MRSWPYLMLAFLLLIAGCAGRPDQPMGKKVLDPPAQVPAPPAMKAVPLDQDLVSKASNVIFDAARNDDAFLRANAIETLREMPGDEASHAVLNALSDPQPAVRFAACVASGERHLAAAKEPLLRMVHGDDDPSVRVSAIFALHMLGDTRFSHELEKTAQSPSPHVRANTALVLGLLGEKSAVRILDVLERDVSPAVRIQASEALWRLGDEQGLQDLVGYSISQYPDDQIIAVVALAEPRDQRVKEHVRGLLTSDYPEVALAAARAMGMLGSDLGYRVAEKAVDSKDPRQRALAALAFGTMGRTDAQPYLAQLLKDNDLQVRVSAAAGMMELARENSAAG